MDLTTASDKELAAELERRKLAKELAETPKMLKNIDWTEVINNAESEVDDILAGTYHEDNDDAQYMYEAVMQAVYGKKYFEWKNKKTN